MVPLSLPMPPGTCRVAATVLGVVPPDPGEAGPCSTIPCSAMVRIDSVLGYGPAFPEPLSAGKVISVRFRYTLSPSKELFPSISILPLPLGKGDAFVAVLEGTDAPAPGGHSVTAFGVTTYEKR